LRKVRRISAADRGDYFLGTDFTYDDIKNERKVDLQDYRFSTLSKAERSGQLHYQIEALPRSEAIQEELGYGKVIYWVRADIWMITAAEYTDPKGTPLKTFEAEDIRQVDGIWTRHQLTVNNLKTGHSTHFSASEVNYRAEVRDSVFTERTMVKGP